MLTKADRIRIGRRERVSARYRQLAAETDDGHLRDRYEHYARRSDQLIRSERRFPLGIRLWGLGVTAVLTPWAFVLHYGFGWWGAVPSAVLAGLLLRFRGRRLAALEAQEQDEGRRAPA